MKRQFRVVAFVLLCSAATHSAAVLTLSAVESRKAHNPTVYNIGIDPAIPIGGSIAVEPRLARTSHQVVFRFSDIIASVGTAKVINGYGAPVGTATPTISGNEVLVTLTGIPNNTRLTVALTGVNGTLDVAASVAFVVGDINRTGVVTASDISALKARQGNAVNASNSSLDIDLSGQISSADLVATKARSAASLPPAPSTLEYATVAIVAAVGGTITLPGGSSVTIPAGALASDQNVTLSLVQSAPPQPPSGLLTSIGPSLTLTFGTASPFTGTAQQYDLRFVLKYPTTPARRAGAIPMVDIVDEDNFAGIITSPLACDPSSACFSVPANAFQKPPFILQMHTFEVNVPPVPAAPLRPINGGKSWDGSRWVDGVPASFPPNSKCVLLVHGMMSQVETAFQSAETVEGIKSAGGYNCVIGFNYNWCQSINTSGNDLSAFLSNLKSLGLKSVDIDAHSEGGPVTMSGVCRNADMPIGNLSFLGSPLTGTPATAAGSVVQVAGNNVRTTLDPFHSLLAYLSSPFAPPPTCDLLNGPFAGDLRPNSPVLLANNDCVAKKMNNQVTDVNLLTTHVTCAGGFGWAQDPNAPCKGTFSMKGLGKVLNDMNAFGVQPNDGIVLASPCENTGLPPARLTKLSAFNLSHTQLTCDPAVISSIGQQVIAHPYAAPTCDGSRCYNICWNTFFACNNACTTNPCLNACLATFNACPSNTNMTTCACTL